MMQGGPEADPLAVHDISLDQANLAVQTAVNRAKALHIHQDIAVVDAGGNLKAFARMDEAWLGSIDIAIKKAKTARYFDMPTGAIGKLSQPGEPAVPDRGLQRRADHVPRRRPDQVRRRPRHRRDRVSGSSVENDDSRLASGGQAVSKAMGSGGQ